MGLSPAQRLVSGRRPRGGGGLPAASGADVPDQTATVQAQPDDLFVTSAFASSPETRTMVGMQSPEPEAEASEGTVLRCRRGARVAREESNFVVVDLGQTEERLCEELCRLSEEARSSGRMLWMLPWLQPLSRTSPRGCPTRHG